MILLHVPTFSLAASAGIDSGWHRLHAQVRLAFTLILVLGVALVPDGAWGWWGLYGALLLGLVGVSRVAPLVLFGRLGVELVFVGAVLLTVLFSGRGETVWQWGPLVVGAASLVTFLSILVRAVLSLWLLNLLTLTTPAPNLLQALAGFGCPTILVRLLESMLRHVAVLIDELGSMQRAAEARAGKAALLNWRTLGNLLGALFLRTYGRGERGYQAMLARGFAGRFPDPSARPWRFGEKALVFLAATLALGIALFSRWQP